MKISQNTTWLQGFLSIALLFFSSKQLWAQCTNINTSSAFVTCVTNGTSPISLQNNAVIVANLTGLSLAGITIDLGGGNTSLTISGNPIVNSSTSFSGSGSSQLVLQANSGSFTYDANGANAYSVLNGGLAAVAGDGNPNNNTLHAGAVQAGASSLPVELSSFVGINENSSKIILSWQTATELNNSKFIIETSHQGETFQRIGEVAGAGTTTEPQNYSFTHHTPSAGINYYRLKQVDFDGTFEYSKVIAINAPGSNDVFAFPNPAREKISVQYDQSKGAGNIQLLDALGRRINANIAGYAGNYEVTLPESLARGTYWLKVERNGKVQTLPVVKE